MVDPLPKGLAREKVFRTSESMRLKPIEKQIVCEANPTWNTGDPKNQVQQVIIDHKWYEENRARTPGSSILLISLTSWSERNGWT